MKEDSRNAGATQPPASDNPPERHTVRRRYRRSLGGWWWLALVLVPLVLAGLTMGLDHTSGSASADSSKSPAASPSSSTASASSSSASESSSASATSSASSSSSSSASSAAEAAKPFSIARDGEDITVTAAAASDAAKKDLLDAVRQNAPDGAKVVDKVTVEKDAADLPKAASIGALLGHVKGSKDFGLSFDGKKTVLEGTVDSAATKSSVADEAKAAFPASEVVDKLTADAKGSDTSKDKACDTSALKAKAEDATAWFAFASATILPSSQDGLAAFADAAKACTKSDITITLTGYTDNTGTDAVNSPLSKRRAEAVRQYLVAHGVKVEITSEYKGAQNPIASNDTENGRAKNRRVVAQVK